MRLSAGRAEESPGDGAAAARWRQLFQAVGAREHRTRG